MILLKSIFNKKKLAGRVSQLLLFLFAMGAGRPCSANIVLSALYSDNMVVQSGQAFVIRGSSDPFETIAVQVGSTTKKCRADRQGHWRILMPAIPANTSFDIVITTARGEQQSIRNAISGELWLCSGQSNMGMPVSGSDVKKQLEATDLQEIRYFIAQNDPAPAPVDQVQGHWVICDSQNMVQCSAVGLSFAWNLNRALHRPVGLIINAVGGTPVESWTSPEILKSKTYDRHIFQEREQWKKDRSIYQKEYDLKIKDWELAAKKARESGQAPPLKIYPPFPLRENWNPGSLYHSLVWPLRDIVFKGVVWYQGESNANYPFVYRYQLADMIGCWRDLFNNRHLPFYIIQLPEYGSVDDWAVIRESQAVAAHLENTALVVTLGLGDSSNIHPVAKMEVGRRTALQVLKKEYHQHLVASGPLFSAMKVTGNRVTLEFDCSGSTLQTSDGMPVRNIEIADSSFRFLPASVASPDGNTLVVWNDEIKHPENVRYAWKNVPQAVNLVNAGGLPAPPFFSGNITRHLEREEEETNQKINRINH